MTVYLPYGDSTITPPFMEAYLDLQKQIYGFVALFKTGTTDASKITAFDRMEFELPVKVTGGSSNLESDLKDFLKRILLKTVGRLTGRQASIVVLGLAILLTGKSGFSAWLEHKKELAIEEMKHQENKQALSTLEFANKRELEIIREVVNGLLAQGMEGSRVIDAMNKNFEAFLKAASRTEKSVINGQALDGALAEKLRINPKLVVVTKQVTQEMRAVVINTSDFEKTTIVLENPYTKETFRVNLRDDLFNSADKISLFNSAENRTNIWVELLVKEADGEIKSVDFIRVVAPPLR